LAPPLSTAQVRTISALTANPLVVDPASAAEASAAIPASAAAQISRLIATPPLAPGRVGLTLTVTKLPWAVSPASSTCPKNGTFWSRRPSPGRSCAPHLQ